MFATSTIVLDEGLASVEGEQILVTGRWLSPHAVDEVVANERFITKIGVAVGDEIDVTCWAPDEIGRVTADGDQLHGPSARVRIVGGSARGVNPALTRPARGLEKHRLHSPPGPRGHCLSCHRPRDCCRGRWGTARRVLGRIGWQAVADQIGVASESVTSVIGIAASVLGAILIANLIAAYPARRAARIPTADALASSRRGTRVARLR